MQHGDEELPDFADFLPLWITFLGGHAEACADRFLLEAVDLLNDVSLAVRYAEKFAAVHPSLFLYILENEAYAAAKDMVVIGMKALEMIPKKYVMRSRAALKTAEYVIEAEQETSLLETCYFAAYESDTSILNYFRVLFHGFESEKRRGELRNIFMKIPVSKKDTYSVKYGLQNVRVYSEWEENKPNRNTVLFLRFLDGQFAEVLKEGLNKSEVLGWTGTFMKQGIALYLLYLYEGPWNGKGMTEMARRVKSEIQFSVEEYQRGTCGQDGMDGSDLFCRLFIKWKSMVQMKSDVRVHAMKKITVLLEKRTEGIMNANRRNYYGECAAYIAALGEVRESLGETNAKQRIMTSYRDKYSRRSAFREEMRDYGWIDVKRR